MTWWQWVLVGLAAWSALAIVFGVILGKAIQFGDRRTRGPR